MLELSLITLGEEFPCGKSETNVAKKQLEVTQICSWLSNGCGKRRQTKNTTGTLAQLLNISIEGCVLHAEGVIK